LLQHGKFQHKILEIGALVYEFPAYYAGTPTRGKFQYNILDIGASVLQSPVYYAGPVYYTGTPVYEFQYIILEYFSDFEQCFLSDLSLHEKWLNFDYF